MIRFWRRREKPTFLPPGAFQVYTHGAWSMFLMDMCVHIQKPEARFRCGFLGVGHHVCLRQGLSLTWRLSITARLLGQQAPRHLLTFACPWGWDLQVHIIVYSLFFLMWVLGIELSSSHLCGNHFTYWPISPVPYGSFEIFIFCFI